MSAPAIAVSPRDRETLRRLAERVAGLAARPVEEEKRALCTAHNELRPTRPLVFCDPENGWNEIIGPQDLECEDGLARGWEYHLRREIFWGERMRDDRVILAEMPVGYVYTETDWGMSHRQIGQGGACAYTWDPPLKDYADMDRLRYPQITVDRAATDAIRDLAAETFDGLLSVRVRGAWWWSLGMTGTLVLLRGLEQMHLDMVDRPDDLHRLMAFLRDGTLARLDWLEREGLLTLNTDAYVGSGGFGWTRELPAPDFTGRVRTKDMWGFAESQETVSVSPRMFAEFVLPYQLPILERFGLNCYGCCEPLDTRWEHVKTVPRLRRVSVSPWSNLERMAGCLSDRYVFSMKPNPAALAAPSFDEEAVRAGLREALRVTSGCRVEMVMKDCHTIGGEPDRVVRWVRIAREEAERAF